MCAFIDKKDPVVLNIKLTSLGRELLSKGILNFSYYTIGDSEIDYNFNTNVIASNPSYSPSFSNILRPTDKNPNLLSFVTRNLSGNPYNFISNVPSTPTIIQNTAQPLGFFSVNSGIEFRFAPPTCRCIWSHRCAELSGHDIMKRTWGGRPMRQSEIIQLAIHRSAEQGTIQYQTNLEFPRLKMEFVRGGATC